MLFFIAPFFVSADSEGEIKNFFIDYNYDIGSRPQIEAVLKKVSAKAYFYLEKEWYDNLGSEEKAKISEYLKILTQEFDEKIYPELIVFYGQEWSPGVDNDYKITILFHQMKNGVAGYFNSGDEYEKIQSPSSNQREIIYINIENISYEIVKSYIAHEFVHLITFNLKDRLGNIEEEIWLNEMRADFSPTILGYDNENYDDKNIKQRIRAFLENPIDSLVEWQGQKKDYGLVSVFSHYLVDYYGEEILSNSIRSQKIGIDSIEEILKKRNANRNFEEVFGDWTIAVLLNNCAFGVKYCYKDENIKNVRITPSLIFLPTTQKTSISLSYSIKPWSANWYRILSGEGDLNLKFDGNNEAGFKVSYVLCKNGSFCQVDYLSLDKSQDGELTLNDFGKNWSSLTLIPFVKSKISGFNSNELSYDFSLSVSLENKNEEEIIKTLKARIVGLQAQISDLQAKLAVILKQRNCGKFSKNLYLGMKDFEVECLQKFLASQGPDIYPQSIISGFFGQMTQTAVIKFQEKYALEILKPLGYRQGTGIVGVATRAKINTLIP